VNPEFGNRVTWKAMTEDCSSELVNWGMSNRVSSALEKAASEAEPERCLKLFESDSATMKETESPEL